MFVGLDNSLFRLKLSAGGDIKVDGFDKDDDDDEVTCFMVEELGSNALFSSLRFSSLLLPDVLVDEDIPTIHQNYSNIDIQ